MGGLQSLLYLLPIAFAERDYSFLKTQNASPRAVARRSVSAQNWLRNRQPLHLSRLRSYIPIQKKQQV